MSIPAAAVEAAAEIAFNRHGAKYYSRMGEWADLEPRFRAGWIEDARQILAAVAPHMHSDWLNNKQREEVMESQIPDSAVEAAVAEVVRVTSGELVGGAADTLVRATLEAANPHMHEDCCCCGVCGL